MLDINWADVENVVSLCLPYLVFFGVVAVAALIVAIAAVRIADKARRHLVRMEAALACVLALLLSVNLICWGPVSNMLTLATTPVSKISDDTIQQARDLGEEITDNGIVLLKNDDGYLPIQPGNINVFGWASTQPVYGGMGSGSLNENYPSTSLLQGLADSGFTTNQDLTDFYTSYAPARPDYDLFALASGGGDWTLPEPPASSYSDSLMSDAKGFSDTAIVVIGRVGCEGADLPEDMGGKQYTQNSDQYADFEEGDTYLQLSHTERNLVDMVCQNFDNVVVVYNGGNTFELGFLDQYPQIRAALWVPGAGQMGFDSLGKILTGEVNPSGRTSDTFLYNLKDAPTFNNFGSFAYDNADEYISSLLNQFGGAGTPSFVNYNEGIYVGYRYYETAAAEGAIDYDSVVQYPFGYGLSYTTFDQRMGSLSYDGKNLSVDVTVTNTGNAAGREVVEAYSNPPYTNGGIEKASANLVAFEKTPLLKPGESTTVTLTWSAESMASYDENAAGGEGAYVLEAGDYQISINRNAHEQLGSAVWALDSTITYDDANPRSTDKQAAHNEFEGDDLGLTVLSRANGFANLADATAGPTTYDMSDEQKAAFVNETTYDAAAEADPDAQMPTTGAQNGVVLNDLRGADFDDPKWDELLDELTPDDMNNLIGNGAYQTVAIDSIGKIATTDIDGPAALNNNFTQQGSLGMPVSTTVACTWDKDLARQYGEITGQEAQEMKVSGWYAPSMNIHRSAFGGRNFEYYSEDPLLAGTMAANTEAGAFEYGIYGYIKHFALNEQESNRWTQLCTWADEQSIREIYLKPFEMAVKDGNAHAVMSSYNYIGGTWAGADGNLLENVLRGEWGFDGMVLTDYFAAPWFMLMDQAVRNGGDIALAPYASETNYVNVQDATGVTGMRNAAHDILYTVVNSNAYANGGRPETPIWQFVLIGVDVAGAALIILCEAKAIRRYRRTKDSD